MKINISHVAKLANLPLTDDEAKTFEGQLAKTLEYVEQLNEIDTQQIEPTAQVTGLENVMREDTTISSLTQKEALANAPKTKNGFFQVKGIFTDE